MKSLRASAAALVLLSLVNNHVQAEAGPETFDEFMRHDAQRQKETPPKKPDVPVKTIRLAPQPLQEMASRNFTFKGQRWQVCPNGNVNQANQGCK